MPSVQEAANQLILLVGLEEYLPAMRRHKRANRGVTMFT